MELERDYPYKKIFDVTVHLQSVSIVLPECGVRQACVVFLSRSPSVISSDSLRDFSMVRVEFSNLILKTCLDDEDESYNEDPLFQVNIDTSPTSSSDCFLPKENSWRTTVLPEISVRIERSSYALYTLKSVLSIHLRSC